MATNPDWALAELHFTLHALALDADEALATQSEDSSRPNELALSFGDALLAALDYSQNFTATQLGALNEVAEVLRKMSSETHGELWTETAVYIHPAWNQVRSLARNALREFEWDGGQGH
jgi:hypothetical protein